MDKPGRLHFDFETRSCLNLNESTAYRYAAHPSTEVLIMSYGQRADDIRRWFPGDPIPPEFFDPELIYVAHNAAFERLIYAHILVPKYGFPPVEDERWVCTAAKSAYHGLPRSLEKGSEIICPDDARKDVEGGRVMKRLSHPQRVKGCINAVYIGGQYDTSPDKMKILHDYCDQDVRAELAIDSALADLTPYEMDVYRLDLRINDRGIPIDREFCKGVVAVHQAEMTHLSTQLYEDTRHWTPRSSKAKNPEAGVTSISQRARIVEYLTDELGLKLPLGSTGTPSLSAELITPFLDTLGDSPEHTQGRRIIETYLAGSSIAVAKFQSAICQMDSDNRVRGQLSYHGAQTGRFASRGLQVHNFKKSGDVDESLIQAVTACDYDRVREISEQEGTSITKLLSKCVRHMIAAPPGKTLVYGDWNAIEGRGLAWAAGCQSLLDVYASGKCVYSDAAAKIYGVPADEIYEGHKAGDPEMKNLRQRGKLVVLGLGYGAGASKFEIMAKSQGVVIPVSECEDIVQAFRTNYPEIPKFWRDCGNASLAAVDRPGRRVRVGHVSFHYDGEFLRTRLPSGRDIHYYQPTIERGNYGPEIMYTDNRGVRTGIYSSKWVENIVQGLCRCILTDALLTLDKTNTPVIFHVHDEIVTEVDEPRAKFALKKLLHVMNQTPKWAEGFPIKAEGYISRRYEK